jgi:hypothetical protein
MPWSVKGRFFETCSCELMCSPARSQASTPSATRLPMKVLLLVAPHAVPGLTIPGGSMSQMEPMHP